MRYVELHCHSAYSFLDGASQPEELAARAAELGYAALALDRSRRGLRLARVRPCRQGARSQADHRRRGDARRRLARHASRRVGAGVREPLPAAHGSPTLRTGSSPSLDPERLEDLNEGLVCLSGCARHGPRSASIRTPQPGSRSAFGRERFLVELQRPYLRGDARRNAALRDLARDLGVRTVATGNVHAHHPRRDTTPGRPRRDPAEDLARRLRAGAAGQRGVRASSAVRAGPRFPDDPDAVADDASSSPSGSTFDLTEELGYRYPDFSDGSRAGRRPARSTLP